VTQRQRPNSLVSNCYRLKVKKAHFPYFCKVRFVEIIAHLCATYALWSTYHSYKLFNYVVVFRRRKIPPRNPQKVLLWRTFFSKSLMNKLTLTLIVTESHDDDNNVILCCGVNMVWNLGRRESPGQKLRSRTFGRWHRKSWQLSFQFLVYQGITLINPNTIWGVIKQEFVIFMTPTSISVIGHHFHQQNIYLIRILCRPYASSS